MAEVNFIYENFLNNKATYNFNRGYWKRLLFNKLALEFEDYNDYIVYETLNGHRFYDGNPMFSHLNPSKRKGFRIIQENPQDLKELDLEKFEFVQHFPYKPRT